MNRELGNIMYDATKYRTRQELIGHKVIKVEQVDSYRARLYLDNGIVLKTTGNEGCGGCSAGHFMIEALNKCDNVITNVVFTTECEAEMSYGTEYFTIFVFAEDERIKLVEYSGWDNGYYGRGFYVDVEDDFGF